jgi:predicted O-methyltransferase YrrM
MEMDRETLKAKVLGRPWTAQSDHKEAPSLKLVDVTDRLGEFDPAVLGILQTAPVWMTPAERLLLFTVAYGLRPARYLEIGTLQGGSALVVAAALDALKTDGRMICLDPNPQVSDAHWEKLRHRAQLLRGFSPDALPEARERAGGPFDLVLIDGEHTAAGVARDARAVLSVVGPGAVMLFHDSFNPDVGQAIDAFVREHAMRVRDNGPMTREITHERLADGSTVVWGGLRLVTLC